MPVYSLETKTNAREGQMGSTYYSLHYHWVCSTKHRRPFIGASWRSLLHQYLGGTVRGLQGVPLRVGGVEDHVHLLMGLKTVHAMGDFSRELKKASSVWAGRSHEPQFEWQEGYAVFSVSADLLGVVSGYIERQEVNHQRTTFDEELKQLLKEHGISYDPKYLV